MDSYKYRIELYYRCHYTTCYTVFNEYLKNINNLDIIDRVDKSLDPKQKKKVNNHVLEDFKEDEEEKIKEITENIVKQIPTLIDKKMDLFSSKVNQNLNGI